MSFAQHRVQYWRRTLQITVGLLAFWLLVTLVTVLWAPHWRFSVLGWPVGFWAAAQGALGLFCLIVWAYAWGMDWLDGEFQRRADQD